MHLKTSTTYVAKSVDANGYADYNEDENKIWNELITRQIPIVTGRACNEYMIGLDALNLTHDRIPQCPEVNKVLNKTTGWGLEPVAALIPFKTFFNLLANKKFPAATFIRRREELDYLQEPDIFHEIFGHCPMLTNAPYAEFTQLYGRIGENASHDEQVMLAKLYWFTIEFGLLKTPNGLRAYGGGILSSKTETAYCIESDVPLRKPFDVMEVLRTPYRIDILQPIYYVLEDLNVLYSLLEMDLIGMIHEAKQLGMRQPLYQPKVKIT